jgi:hypothetical protein
MNPSRMLRLAAVLASATVAASITLAGTASADPPLNERFHDEFSDVINDYCGVPGLTVRSDTVVDGRTLIHSGRHIGFMEHASGTFVDTNLANGSFISGSFNNMQRATDAIDNGDGTATVTFLATGNFVTYGSDGKAIARNPGQVRFELLIDHNDTPTDPTDDEFIAFIREVRPSTGRTDDFCAAAVPALTD